MKYIEKNYEAKAVTAHEAELVKFNLDEASLLRPDVFPRVSGGKLYDRVRDMETFPSLKAQMYEDQGGICCYCGAKLEFPYDPQYNVEHVLPKEHHRELVGEYKNLLLSCHLTSEEKQGMGEAAKRERKIFLHCDPAKGSTEITYSPLRRECETQFIYLLNGEVKGLSPAAEDDIITLGLNCEYLKRRRSDAIREILFAGEEMLSTEELELMKVNVMKRDVNNRHAEFCFVIAGVLKQFTEQPS